MRGEKITYEKGSMFLCDDDNPVREAQKSLEKMILDARREAFKKHIEVNSVIINTNMVEVPGDLISDGSSIWGVPPMICGLYAYFTKDELPEGYSFAILKGPKHRTRLEQFESIGMEPDELKKAAKLYRSVMNQLLEE